MNSKIYSRPQHLRVFLHLLLNASHNNEAITKSGISIKRGQYLRSFRKLQEDLVYEENRQIKLIPLGSLKRIIDFLRVERMVSIDETDLGTLFTVIKYDDYQLSGTDLGTDCEQTANNNKNDKNEKNELNKKDSLSSSKEKDNFCKMVRGGGFISIYGDPDKEISLLYKIK